MNCANEPSPPFSEGKAQIISPLVRSAREAFDAGMWRSREGIDDLRYLVTLERRIAAAKSSGREPAAVSRAEALLERIADGIMDNWTAYTDGGETFPGDGFVLMSTDKSAGLTHYQSVRRALADAIMELPQGGSTP